MHLFNVTVKDQNISFGTGTLQISFPLLEWAKLRIIDCLFFFLFYKKIKFTFLRQQDIYTSIVPKGYVIFIQRGYFYSKEAEKFPSFFV